MMPESVNFSARGEGEELKLKVSPHLAGITAMSAPLRASRLVEDD
jgi:hypothetical protein